MERKEFQMKDKDNSGALFVNDQKEKDTQPDWSGPCVVNGKKMRVSAWKNKAKGSGKEYIGLAFSEPMEKPKTKDDEIPF